MANEHTETHSCFLGDVPFAAETAADALARFFLACLGAGALVSHAALASRLAGTCARAPLSQPDVLLAGLLLSKAARLPLTGHSYLLRFLAKEQSKRGRAPASTLLDLVQGALWYACKHNNELPVGGYAAALFLDDDTDRSHRFRLERLFQRVVFEQGILQPEQHTYLREHFNSALLQATCATIERVVEHGAQGTVGGPDAQFEFERADLCTLAGVFVERGAARELIRGLAPPAKAPHPTGGP